MNLNESLEAIKQLVGNEDWSQVVDVCDRTLAVFPDSLDIYHYLGKALNQLGQVEQAIAAYQQGLRCQPNSASSHAELGRLYCQEERFALAISHYQKALKVAPHWSNVHYNLGVIFHQLGRWQEASAAYQCMLDSLPIAAKEPALSQSLQESRARAYFGLGAAQGQIGHPALSIAYYQKAIQANPAHWPSYKNLAYLLAKRNAYDQANALYDQALNHCDHHAPIYVHLGRMYRDQEQLPEALNAYHQAIELDPQLAIAHYDLGKCWLHYQHYPEANHAFETALNLGFDHGALATTWGTTLLEQGQWLPALNLFKKAIENQSDWIKAYTQQVANLSSDNAFDRVRIAAADLLTHLQTVDDVADAIPSLGQAYEAIANLFYESQIVERAAEAFHKALWINPHQPQIYLKLGDCFAEQERWDEAIAIYHAGLLDAPTHARLLDAYNSLLQQRQQEPFKFLLSELLKGIYIRTFDWFHAEGSSLTHSVASPKLFQEIAWSGTHGGGNRDDKTISPRSPLPLAFQKDQRQSSNACGGVTCARCMGTLIESFCPSQLAANIYRCSSQSQVAQAMIPPHEAFVATIPQGRAWIAPRRNAWLVCDEIAIITPENYLLGDLSRFYPWYLPGCQNHALQRHSISDRHELPPVTSLNGNVAVLSSLSGNVYYHWMIDVLPRIGILQRSSWDLEHIDWFVVNSLRHSFQKETLQALGIPLEKVVESDRSSHIKASTLIVPSFPGHLDWVSQGTIEFLRHTFLPLPSSVPQSASERELNRVLSSPPAPNEASNKRIYISRASARYRKVLNEEAVIAGLEPLGFKVIQLEDYSVAQQAQLFAQADIIISPHGSSLTNLVFCQSNTVVIELFSPHYMRTDYWMISQHLNLQHYYLLCEDFKCYPMRRLMYQTPLTEDLYVDVSKLKTCVQMAVQG